MNGKVGGYGSMGADNQGMPHDPSNGLAMTGPQQGIEQVYPTAPDVQPVGFDAPPSYDQVYNPQQQPQGFYPIEVRYTCTKVGFNILLSLLLFSSGFYHRFQTIVCSSSVGLLVGWFQWGGGGGGGGGVRRVLC